MLFIITLVAKVLALLGSILLAAFLLLDEEQWRENMSRIEYAAMKFWAYLWVIGFFPITLPFFLVFRQAWHWLKRESFGQSREEFERDKAEKFRKNEKTSIIRAFAKSAAFTVVFCFFVFACVDYARLTFDWNPAILNLLTPLADQLGLPIRQVFQHPILRLASLYTSFLCGCFAISTFAGSVLVLLRWANNDRVRERRLGIIGAQMLVFTFAVDIFLLAFPGV